MQNIIWSTGFIPNYQWIEIEGAVNQAGMPIHTRGVSVVSGLYYIGLPWQHQRGSALLCGVARDAEFILSIIEGQKKGSVTNRTDQLYVHELGEANLLLHSL